MSDSHLLNTNNIVNLDTYLASNYVTQDTAQTISGSKTFTAPLTVTQSNTVSYFSHLKNTTLASNNVTPSYQTIETIQFEANNGNRVGHLRGIQNTNGEYTVDLLVNSGVSGSQKTAGIAVGLNSAGNAFTLAPTPTDTTSTSSQQIATVGWSNTNLSRTDLSNSPYTTNRILEIPQDIKLELNNSTLTLKAGSKLYYPDGLDSNNQPKFVTRITTEDYVANGQYGYDPVPHILSLNQTSYWVTPYTGLLFSGDTTPTGFGQYALWYDTANNVIKWTNTSGSTWTVQNSSLPFGIATYNGGSYANGFKQIDKVFNGYSWIGNTIFTLPGFKVEFADGRNTDGTCKSDLYTQQNVRVFPVSFGSSRTGKYPLLFRKSPSGIESTAFNYYFVSSSTQLPAINCYFYDSETNLTGGISSESIYYFKNIYVGTMTLEAGVLKSVNIETVADSIVNSNMYNISSVGRSFISGIGMPSSKYEELTLGASGTTYSAPANGYVFIDKKSTAASQYVYIEVYDTGLKYRDVIYVPDTAENVVLRLPVLKGDRFVIYYTANGATNHFKFIYAQGEV